MRKIALVALILPLLAVGIACGGGQKTPSPPPAGVAVTIENFAFHPETIAVGKGTQVT